jgi:hypothetical protein
VHEFTPVIHINDEAAKRDLRLLARVGSG